MGKTFISKEAPSIDASGADTSGADTIKSTNLELDQFRYNGIPIDGLDSLMPSTIACIVPTFRDFGACNIYSFALVVNDVADDAGASAGAGAGAGASAADVAFTSDIVTQEKFVVVAETNIDQLLNISEIQKIKHLKIFHLGSSIVTDGSKTSTMGSSEFCHIHFFDKQNISGANAIIIKTAVREVGIVFKCWMLLIVAGLFLVAGNGQRIGQHIVASGICKLFLSSNQKIRFKTDLQRSKMMSRQVRGRGHGGRGICNCLVKMAMFALLLRVADAVDCTFSGQTYSSGTTEVNSLVSGSVCTMASQAIIQGSLTVLSIRGEENAATKAIIERHSSCTGLCRLFYVKGAKLMLSWVHLRGGFVSNSQQWDESGKGGLVYILKDESGNLPYFEASFCMFGTVIAATSSAAYMGGGICMSGGTTKLKHSLVTGIYGNVS